MKTNPPRKLTKEERAAIRTLERLAKRWPKTLVLHGGGGNLAVLDSAMSMRYHEFESKGQASEWTQQTILARIGIFCEGGDPW